MQIYEGDELESYKEDHLCIKRTWHKRNFVQQVKTYFEGRSEKIFAVSGLRGTGKTVGMLQAAEECEHKDKVVYVLTQRDENETAEDYINFLKNTDKKVIIFDEYSWIKDREKLDKYLLTAIQNEKRIVLAATESITLDFMNYGDNSHRIQPVHTTMFTYEEYLRLNDRVPSKTACTDYLIWGGLFEDYILKNFESAKAYIESAIVSNLAGYLKSRIDKKAENAQTSKDMSLEERARTLTYSVLYKAICPSNLSSIPTLRSSGVTLENCLEQMGVNTELIPQEGEIEKIAEVFEQTGIIVRIPNFNRNSALKEQFYITNPSLTCQLIKGIYGLSELDSSILGHVFESAIAVQLATNRLSNHKIWFYNSGTVKGNPENKELDIVITDNDEELAYFFECKFRQKDTLASDVTMISGYLEEHEFRDVDILGRYVVYNGRPKVRDYENIGTVLFTPIGRVLDNYFEFSKNVADIKDREMQIRQGKDGHGSTGQKSKISQSLERLVNSLAEKAKSLKDNVSQIISNEQERITASFRVLKRRMKQAKTHTIGEP